MLIKKTSSHLFFVNLMYAFLAQGISLMLSAVMALVVPKELNVTGYGYWQLFLLYSSYVGFFHFGLDDGVYLRYGGIPYFKLNHRLIGSQFWILVFSQLVIALIGILYTFLYVANVNRAYVLYATAAFLILNNVSNFMYFIFQLSNRTKVYSVSVIISKISFLLFVFILLIRHETRFQQYIVFYGISQFLSLVYCVLMGNQIVFSHLVSLHSALVETWENIKVGISLLLSNISDMLVIGSGRFVIDAVWGIKIFGKISFAISMVYFFMQFISQVSMVLFPALRQTSHENLRKYFIFGRDLFGFLLPVVFLFYLPFCLIIGHWLPQYKESLTYMAIMLPLCTYDGKMQMLCSTYLKVLRKEKILLLSNACTMAASVSLSLCSGYLFHNFYFTLISMLLCIAVRSIATECYLSSHMQIKPVKSILIESFFAVLFLVLNKVFSTFFAFIFYSIAFILYLFVNKKKVIHIFSMAKQLV